jgi:hypothetical protein
MRFVPASELVESERELGNILEALLLIESVSHWRTFEIDGEIKLVRSTQSRLHE